MYWNVKSKFAKNGVEKKLPEGWRKSLLNLRYYYGWKSENGDICIGMSSQTLHKSGEETSKKLQKVAESLY